eukprot:269624-Chlamydomonas_euryale.AAC.2
MGARHAHTLPPPSLTGARHAHTLAPVLCFSFCPCLPFPLNHLLLPEAGLDRALSTPLLPSNLAWSRSASQRLTPLLPSNLAWSRSASQRLTHAPTP